MLLLMLTVKIGKDAPQFLEPRNRYRPIVDIASGATIGGDHPAQNQGSAPIQILVQPKSDQVVGVGFKAGHNLGQRQATF